MMRHPVPIACSLALLIVVPALAQKPPAISPAHQQFLQKLVDAAVERTHHIVRYDPAYVRIPYPNGDVPANTGVCTDEIIRVYRAVGIDSVDPIQRVTGFIPTATYSFSEAAT